VALLLWIGYEFFKSSTALPDHTPVGPASVDEPAPEVTATVVETPRLETVLVDAGVERDRLRWENGHLRVETFDSVDSIVAMLEAGMPGGIVERDGAMLTVAHDEIVERVRVVTLLRDTEDSGFVPVDAAPRSTPRERPPGKRRIVLILDDVGYENQPLDEASTIDARISFAVIPGTPRARRSAELLAGRGYEILCHLPMEPLDPAVSPGDGAIMIDMPDETIRLLATENIASIPHVKGVNNHMGSRATRDRRVMEIVADVLRQKGVFFIDSRTAGSSVAAQVTREAKVPTGSRDVFLDDDPSEPAVRKQLRLLARLADSREFVVGIGHVYPMTVRVLQQEIPKLAEEGYEFLFPSDVLR
jgi:polysaccharide deacetylase 2 family uncharacterized protein YibQ